MAQVRGTDDRVAMTALTTPAERAAGVIATLDSSARDENWYTLRHMNFGTYMGMCPGEKLADANAIRGGNCSLTLVAPDIAVTALHCLGSQQGPGNNCSEYGYYFGLTHNNLGGRQNVADSLRYCEHILASGAIGSEYENNQDWAIIKLNEPVPNFTAPPLAPPGLPNVGDRVTTIGTPQGVPSVRSTGRIEYVDREGRGVRTDMDIVGGNSGGGAFNERGEFIGIVTTSYDRDRIFYYETSGCARWLQAPSRQDNHNGSWVTGGGVLPLDYFRADLMRVLNENGYGPNGVPAVAPESEPVETDL